MACLCVAVLGKENEPLYLRDFCEQSAAETTSPHQEDFFGFASAVSKSSNDSLALRLEFMMHASLDRLEEITGHLPGQRWRNLGTSGADANWIGHLCTMEDSRIYGYITTTNIKFLAMIEDSPEGITSTREAELKALFSKIHDHYVQYTLNPFSQIREKITSGRFDDGVKTCVEKFDEKRQVDGVAWA